MCLSVWVACACAVRDEGRQKETHHGEESRGGRSGKRDVRVDFSDSVPTLWFLFQRPHEALVLTAFKTFH